MTIIYTKTVNERKFENIHEVYDLESDVLALSLEKLLSAKLGLWWRSLSGQATFTSEIVGLILAANVAHSCEKTCIEINSCYRRTGIMRSRSSNHAKSDSHNARSQGKGKRKPPKVCIILCIM